MVEYAGMNNQSMQFRQNHVSCLSTSLAVDARGTNYICLLIGLHNFFASIRKKYKLYGTFGSII